MKKLLTIITLTAVAVFAHAKTSEDLVKEYDTLIAKGLGWWEACSQIVDINPSDCSTVFASWKDTIPAKFTPGEEPNKNTPEAEKLQNEKLAKIMCVYMKKNPTELVNSPLRTALVRNSNSCLHILRTSNPNIYDELKGKDFVVDGYKLQLFVILNLAESQKDDELICSLGWENTGGSRVFVDAWKRKLATMSALNAYKATCEAEDYFMKKSSLSEADQNTLKAVRDLQDMY